MLTKNEFLTYMQLLKWDTSCKQFTQFTSHSVHSVTLVQVCNKVETSFNMFFVG